MKAKPHDIMERTRAAGCWLNDQRNEHTGEVDREQELAAFMSIFHRDIKGRRLKQILAHPSATVPEQEMK